MKARAHPFDVVIADAIATIDGAAKDRLLRRLSGLALHKAAGDEIFDALAVEQIIPVSVQPNVPVSIKIGGDGNLVASEARMGTVTYAGSSLFRYSPLPGYTGPDQFAVKDSLGKVVLIRITVR